MNANSKGTGITRQFDNTAFQVEAIDLLQKGVRYPETFACDSTQRSIQFTEEGAP